MAMEDCLLATIGAWRLAAERACRRRRTSPTSRIAVIVKATTSQYWATVFDGADAAAKKLGVQISKLGAHGGDRRRRRGVDHGERDLVQADRDRHRGDQRRGARRSRSRRRLRPGFR